MRIEIGHHPDPYLVEDHTQQSSDSTITAPDPADTTLLRIDQIDEVYRAQLACGSLRSLDTKKLRAELVGLHKPGNPPAIIFSMGGTETLASNCLGAFAQLSNDLQRAGGCLVLYNIPKDVARVLKKTRLDKIISTAKNRSQAMKKARMIQKKLGAAARSAA